MLQLNTREKDILRYIACHGPSFTNQLSKELNIPSSTATAILNNLRKKGLIRQNNHRMFPKGEYPHIDLMLTMIGLAVSIHGIHEQTQIAYLREIRDNDALNRLIQKMSSIDPDIEDIIKSWSSRMLPLIFGVWGHFKTENILNIAQMCLTVSASELVADVEQRGFLLDEETEEQRFTDYFYRFKMTDDDISSQKWFEACKRDHRIKLFLITCFQKTIDDHREQLKNLSANLTIVVE